MNTPLKTLLITSVLSTASIFGASAAPSADSEALESGSERSANRANQEVEKSKGGDLAPVSTRSTKSGIFRGFKLPLELVEIIESYTGERRFWWLNKYFNTAAQQDIRNGGATALRNLRVSAKHAESEVAALLQGIGQMKIEKSGHAVAFFGMKVFQEIFSTVLGSSHSQHLQNILSSFARYIETFNIPQFQLTSVYKGYDLYADNADNVKRYGYNLSKENLYLYAEEGSEEAQRYIALSSAYGVRLKRSLGGEDDNSPLESLENLKQRGWSCVQELLDAGYVEGKEGFDPEHKVLEKFAKRGWSAAQQLLAEGYAQGKHGIAQNPEKLLECATLGWPAAQELVAKGYARGRYGFNQDPAKLLEVANLGWPYAREFVAVGYAIGRNGLEKDLKKLIECANLGWSYAREFVADGYAKGAYEIDKNPEKLLEVAKMGWPAAQELVAKGYASSSQDGFSKDPAKLLEVANLGWLSAQDFVVKGYANGTYGLPKDPTLSRLFQIYFNPKNKGRI
jgi:hypothetical protein